MILCWMFQQYIFVIFTAQREETLEKNETARTKELSH